MSIEAALRRGTHRHPRVRRRAQRPQAGLARVRRRGRGVPRRPTSSARTCSSSRATRTSPMEQHAAVAAVDAGRQAHPLVLDPDAALRPPRARPRSLEMPHEPHPRHRRPRTAAASAGKSDPFSHEMVVARLAQITGRPVKIDADARGGLLHATAAAIRCCMWVRSGVRKDGEITGHALPDAGSTAARTAATASRPAFYTGALQTVTYRIAALQVRGRAASSRTSRPAARSAATGTPQPRFALEVPPRQDLRDELGLDPARDAAATPSCPSTDDR